MKSRRSNPSGALDLPPLMLQCLHGKLIFESWPYWSLQPLPCLYLRCSFLVISTIHGSEAPHGQCSEDLLQQPARTPECGCLDPVLLVSSAGVRSLPDSSGLFTRNFARIFTARCGSLNLSPPQDSDPALVNSRRALV